MTKDRLTILVSGMIAAHPYQGGATWAVLQYLLGFKRLGHDVYFVEPVRPEVLRPAGAALKDSTNAGYFHRVMSEFGFVGKAALLLAGTRKTGGLPYDELRNLSPPPAVLINISGMLTDPDLIGPIPIRVYLDLDPAFNQLWHEAEGIDMRFGGHTHHVTIGQAIGQPGCCVPTCGLDWLKTWQPIVLEYWPVASTPPVFNALTTVGNWRGYGSITYQGVFYGQKAHSLRSFIALPTKTREKFLLALGIHRGESKDLAVLAENDWHLLDPAQVANSPASYQAFIRASKGEWGIAKSGYVASRCGWFSDRSIAYLASGRPVLAQDTGFDRFVPTGNGLFSFKTEADVLNAIEAINQDYDHHSRAARALAGEYFDSDKILNRFLRNVGAIE